MSYPAGRQWIGNATFQPLDLATSLPADAPLWFWQASTQAWRYRLPSALSTVSDAPARLEPGEAIFALHTAAFTLAPADPKLEVRYYHQDHLGSSSVMTEATGQLVSESTFYPFGHSRQKIQPRGLEDIYQFGQKEKDEESGLDYFEARRLISGIGVFASVDPLATSPPVKFLAWPQTQNAYSYAARNPVVLSDPSGGETVGEIIDRKGVEAATEGNNVQAYGWAFAQAYWSFFGAESLGQVVDKGAGNVSKTDLFFAGVEVLGAVSGASGFISKLGKGSQAAEGAVTAARYLEYQALRGQGNSAKEAYALMKQFDAGSNIGGKYAFHFTSEKGAAGILKDGLIHPSGSGLSGAGVYAGTTPTPNALLKNAPGVGWGLFGKGADVRVPFQITQPFRSGITPQTLVFPNAVPIGK